MPHPKLKLSTSELEAEASQTCSVIKVLHTIVLAFGLKEINIKTGTNTRLSL
jgi:hypothetical protein